MAYDNHRLQHHSRAKQAKRVFPVQEQAMASPQVFLLLQELTVFVDSHNYFQAVKLNGVVPLSPFLQSPQLEEAGNLSLVLPAKSILLDGCSTPRAKTVPLPSFSPLTVCAPAHSLPTKPTTDLPQPTPAREQATASPHRFLPALEPTVFVAIHNSLVVATMTGAAPTSPSPTLHASQEHGNH